MATKHFVTMSRITEILGSKAPKVICGLPDPFTTRLFIWRLADEFQVEYVEMLVEAYNEKSEQPRIFHNLHAQIGRYLLNHAKELRIDKIGETKEPDINPFGRETPTQLWKKL